MLNRDKTNAALARAALIAITVIWGSSFVILKNTLDSISVLYLLALRFTLAALTMTLAGIRRLRRLDARHLRAGAGLGALIFLAYVLQTYGLKDTTPGKNAFLTATYCVLTPLLMRLLFKTKLSGAQIAAAFVCLIGIGCVSLQGDFSVGLGDLLSVICGLVFALHIIVTDKVAGKTDILNLLTVQMIAAALLSWIAAPFTRAFPAGLSPGVWGSILYLSVPCTCVCFALQIFGQRHTPPATAAILMTLEAVFGALFSVIFYHERMSERIIVGFVLIFVAILLSELKLNVLSRRRPQKPGRAP